MRQEINGKIVDKIRKLLALGASSNPHEAALAVNHAQRLLAAHNLEMADIQDKPDRADVAKLETVKVRPKWQRIISGCTASAFGCVSINSTGAVSFIGVGADPEIASYTYSYLVGEVKRLSKAFVKGINQDRETHKRSYCMGAADSIAEALQQMAKDTPVTPGALVPVRDALIEATTKEIFPDLRTQLPKTSIVFSRAYTQGLKDGANIQIRKGVTDSGPGAFELALAR